MSNQVLSKDKSAGGVLLVDKPIGWTSHDVVKFVRGFRIGKVGHCGTLDPAASGLLVLVIAAATKLTGEFNSQDKAYEGEMLIGIETDSQDAEGKIIRTENWSSVSEDQILETFDQFLGPQEQIPPMVSAKKVGGKRLYKLARQGLTVDRDPVPITIHNLSVNSIDFPSVSFTVKCSKGTYIRTLCYDIGKEIGCGAHLKSLRRMVSGCFDIKDSYSMQEIKSWDKTKLLDKCIPISVARTYIHGL